MAGSCALIVCAMRKAAYTVPGNGTDSSTSVGWWRCQHLQGQLAQRAVHQVQRRGQRLGQRLEAGLAGRQLLGVAHELEARVDRVAQHVGDVVQVQRGQVARAVVRAQRTEGPGQRIAAIVVDIGVERHEARPLGQEAAAGDAVHQRRVAALQEGQRRARSCAR